MYEDHFGFVRQAFGETVDPSIYVPLASRQAAIRRLRYGLERGQGPALLVAEPGMGKTLVARLLSQELKVTAAHLTFPAMPVAELIEFIAEELGAGPSKASPTIAHALQNLGGWLSASARRGSRPLLVVDEAQLIDDPSVFETLSALLNFATNGPSDLMLLIVGTHELLSKLPAGLSDRLAARSQLAPLNEPETAEYIAGRLAFAGVDRPLFPAETMPLLHRASEGSPRRLNRIADLALLISYAENLRFVTPRAIAIATRDSDPDADLDSFAA